MYPCVESDRVCVRKSKNVHDKFKSDGILADMPWSFTLIQELYQLFRKLVGSNKRSVIFSTAFQIIKELVCGEATFMNDKEHNYYKFISRNRVKADVEVRNFFEHLKASRRLEEYQKVKSGTWHERFDLYMPGNKLNFSAKDFSFF